MEIWSELFWTSITSGCMMLTKQLKRLTITRMIDHHRLVLWRLFHCLSFDCEDKSPKG